MSLITFKKVNLLRRDRVKFSLTAVKALLIAISRRGIKEPNYMWHDASIKNPGIETPGNQGRWSIPISIPSDYQTVTCHGPGIASLFGQRRRYGSLGSFYINHNNYLPGRVLRAAYLVDQALVLTTEGLFFMAHDFNPNFGYHALYRVILYPKKPLYISCAEGYEGKSFSDSLRLPQARGHRASRFYREESRRRRPPPIKHRARAGQERPRMPRGAGLGRP